MWVAGIDLGVRKVSVAMYNGDWTHTVTLMVHPSAREQELMLLSTMLTHAITDADYAFIEEPLVGRGVRASMLISQTAGAVMSTMARSGHRVELVNVKHWKKAIIKNGNASKKDVADWLEQTHPEYFEVCEDQDQIDATCIALYGASLVQRATSGVLHEGTDSRSVPE